MPEYKLTFVVEGRDRGASGVLGGLQKGLGGVAQIAAGGLLADAIRGVGRAVGDFSRNAIEAVGHAQSLAMNFEGLLTNSYMYERQADGTLVKVREYGEAAGLAAKDADGLLDYVSKLAIASPFETEQVEQMARLGLAAKLSTGMVQDFSGAFLDFAATRGLTSENLAFAAEQFLQLKQIGALTTVDLRQLRRLGIDVADIFAVDLSDSVGEATERFGDMSPAAKEVFGGTVIGDLKDFNARLAESPEMIDAMLQKFILMSEEGMAGAAERMTQTIPGMMSTLQDVMTIGSRELFTPIVEAVSPFLADIIGQLSDFATGGQLQEIGTAVAAFVGEQVVPFLSTLWTWLMVKLPAAIAVVSGFWTGTLQPAIQAAMPIISQVWAFLQGNLVPILAGLGAVILAVVVPAIVSFIATAASVIAPVLAIAAVVALLVKAWQKDWGGIRTYLTEAWEQHIKPAFEGIGEWLSVTIPWAIGILKDFWERILLPIIQALWKFVKTYLLPILGLLVKIIGQTLGLAFQFLVGLIKKAIPWLEDLWERADWLRDIFSKVSDVFGWVIEKLGKLSGAISNLTLPDWLTPGSPTPFELGLRGIADALTAVNNVMGSGPLMGVGGRGAGNGGPQYHLHISSSAPTEPILADFRMLEAMGAR